MQVWKVMCFNSVNLQSGCSSFPHSAEDTMWPLSVSCQGRENIHVQWLNPTFPFDTAHLQRVDLNGTCLYGNRTDLKVQIKELVTQVHYRSLFGDYRLQFTLPFSLFIVS